MASGVRSAVRAGRYNHIKSHLRSKSIYRQQKAKKHKTSLIAAVMLAMSLPVAASEYLPLRFEEDWGAHCNKMTPKCWRIAETATLTLGADARVRTQGYWPLDFGIGNMNNQTGDSYTLFRGLVHGDLRVGKYTQMFV